MRTVIPGLFGTPTFELSVTVHRRHHDTGCGVCSACGRCTPCPARRSAEAVIAAAGRDPRSYQVLDAARPAGSPVDGSGPEPVSDGFAINGRLRPLSAAGFGYERDLQ